MSMKQKAKAKLRTLGKDSPLYQYVWDLEKKVNGGKRARRIMSLRKEIEGLHEQLNELEMENHDLLVIVSEVEQAIQRVK